MNIPEGKIVVNNQVIKRTNIIILSGLLFFALLGLVGVTALTIVMIVKGVEHAGQYRPEIFFAAAMSVMVVLATGFVVCVGLAAQIRRFWRQLGRAGG